MTVALPERMYRLFGKDLFTVLVERLIVHTHPWVQAVALRILRDYLYRYVEPRCGYLQEGLPDETAAEDPAFTSDLPYFFFRRGREGVRGGDQRGGGGGGSSSSRGDPPEAAMAVLQQFSALLKRLLIRVEASDVSRERYAAHEAIRHPSRSDALKVMVYASKATAALSLHLLHHAEGKSRGRNGHHRAKEADVVRGFIQHQYAQLHRQMHTTVAPILRQRSVVNYLVRSATMVQFFGGYLAVLPSHEEASPPNPDGSDPVGWLLREGMGVLTFVRDTVTPLLRVSLKAGEVSHTLASFAHQAAEVVQQQLELRREGLCGGAAKASPQPRPTSSPSTPLDHPLEKRQKRRRVEAENEKDIVEAEDNEEESEEALSTLNGVLATLATSMASIRETRKTGLLVKDAKKVLKRNTRAMLAERKRKRKG
ncbi:unnamed protein product [Phytomonas sp. EM1]|nr:unnamed protein product [Phytomonas sp. EM1]|eukprot:CCW64899.1 unnamed protein product [Phytomonas sp. isolate EM1]